MLLLMTTSSFCQQTHFSQSLTRQDYLQKSKNQKTGALVLLVGGTAVLAVTAISAASNIDFSGPKRSFVVPVAIGGAIMLSSLPLFIASGRNKRKAMNVTTYFEIQQTPILANTRLTLLSTPSLSLKFNF